MALAVSGWLPLITSEKGYYKVITKLYHEGYTLQSIFSAGTADYPTLLFVKKL